MIPVKLLLSALTASLIPMNAHAAMCTGVIVNSPARTLYAGLNDYYKPGEKVNYITQKRVVNGRTYYCSWGGYCFDSGDIRLHRVLAVKGNPAKMNGVEIKMNSYETLETCTPNNFETLKD